MHHPGHTRHALAPGNKLSILHVFAFLELEAINLAVYGRDVAYLLFLHIYYNKSA